MSPKERYDVYMDVLSRTQGRWDVDEVYSLSEILCEMLEDFGKHEVMQFKIVTNTEHPVDK